jgi:Na+-transporting NADH:ubiquinone oxidoreductase subunit NqrB
MNIHTFDNHYVTCPICQRNAKPKPIKAYMGLFTCPYCQERLVVCRSGHYVRDPFTLKQLMMCSALRRQSSPLARIIRDFVLFKRPMLALAVVSTIFLGIIAITQQSTSYDQQILPGTEKIKKSARESP